MPVRIIRHITTDNGQDAVEYEHFGKLPEYSRRQEGIIGVRLVDGMSDEELVKDIEQKNNELDRVLSQAKVMEGPPPVGSLQWKMDSQGCGMPYPPNRPTGGK